jgi:hypothetical protein
MPPLWRYFFASEAKADAAPQRARTPGSWSFHLQTAHFQGSAKGAMMPFVDPAGRHPAGLCGQLAAGPSSIQTARGFAQAVAAEAAAGTFPSQ